ncbi:MAG: hypothetical protein MUC60_12785 [Oscillatoria sp. Prado101]|nr:hypothetical protein [Oscillatoria sp. Prado101]
MSEFPALAIKPITIPQPAARHDQRCPPAETTQTAARWTGGIGSLRLGNISHRRAESETFSNKAGAAIGAAGHLQRR